jgi:hypothetical protein
MITDYKNELRVWGIYFGTIFLSLFTHEIGHCIPAWVNGYQAIPTPVKEYLQESVPKELSISVSLAGIVGTFLFSIAILVAYSVRKSMSTAILAGAIAMPGMYTLRYVLFGRGHDGAEFQEAQNALGLDYSGHSLDIAFLLLFLTGTILWVNRIRPGLKVSGRLFLGFVLTLVFVMGLQFFNNLIFDPIFDIR